MTSVSCGGRNRTHVTTVQSRLPVPAQAPPHWRSISCGGRNRTCGPVVQSDGFLPAETTPHRESALRESNPPVQVGSLAPLPLGQGHVLFHQGGSRGTRTHNGDHTRTCFRGRLLIRPDDFPQAAVAGFEPACVSLTGSCLTVGPHRMVKQSGRSDLNRRSRAPEARGFPNFPTS